MEKDKTPYLSRIEWEGLQGKWEVDNLRESPVLPPGSEKIEVWRDDQYKIKAKITGTYDGSTKELFPEYGECGTILPNYEIEGSSDYGMFDCRLEHCVVDTVTSTLFNNSFEADLETYRVRRTLNPESSRRAWLTEWYLNSHKRRRLYPRPVTRELRKEYRKQREFLGEDITFEDAWIRSSGRCVFVETPEVSFVVEPVSEKLCPPWSQCMSIEYRDDWGGIPEADVRDTIANLVSFVIGRPLIGVGSTTFDDGRLPLEQVAISPTEKNLKALSQESEHPPIEIDDRRHPEILETLLRQLVPRYLALKDELNLNEALRGYWLSMQLPLGGNLPELQTNLEIIVNAWFKSKGSKTKGVYLPKKDFEKLFKDELPAIEAKLMDVDYGDRIMRRIRNAYQMGMNERFEFFFDEIELAVGEVEWEAIRARNPMAHGASEVFDPTNTQKMLDNTLSYRTLFNRVLLKLLAYEGKYVDRSARGWPERPIDEPMGGSF